MVINARNVEIGKLAHKLVNSQPAPQAPDQSCNAFIPVVLTRDMCISLDVWRVA